MSYLNLAATDPTIGQRLAATDAAAEISTAYSHLAKARRRSDNPDLLYRLDVAMRDVLEALNKADTVRVKVSV
jgi:hypothetical protein